jgi:hypothetical protein
MRAIVEVRRSKLRRCCVVNKVIVVVLVSRELELHVAQMIARQALHQWSGHMISIAQSSLDRSVLVMPSLITSTHSSLTSAVPSFDKGVASLHGTLHIFSTMRVSTVRLVALKFLSKLHPRTVPTTQESLKLLNYLEGAFNHKLDDHHPSPRAVTGSIEAKLPLPNTSQAADLHLRSLLHHPTFDGSKSSEVTHSKLCQSATSRFTTAIQAGQVDEKLLEDCCRQYREGLKRGETPQPLYRLGQRIAAWQTSLSDAQSRWLLVEIPRTSSSIVPVLIKDGLEDVAWQWLSTLYARPWGLDGSQQIADLHRHLYAEDLVISRMLHEYCYRYHRPQAAVQHYVKASAYRAANTLSEVHHTHNRLVISWKIISTAILRLKNQHDVPAQLYDSLLEYSAPRDKGLPIRGFLELYHPSKPSSELLFRDLQRNGLSLKVQSALPHLNSPHKPRVFFSGYILDAADLALKEGNSTHAKFFLDMTKKTWPSVFVSVEAEGIQPAQQLVKARQDYEVHEAEEWTSGLTLS